jgi:hypothetical protein
MNDYTALVMGLLSFFICPIFGPIAISVGSGALQDDPDDGCAKAGYILGWVNLIMWLAFLAGYCLIFFLGMSLINVRPHPR